MAPDWAGAIWYPALRGFFRAWIPLKMHSQDALEGCRVINHKWRLAGAVMNLEQTDLQPLYHES